jgi:hypothetical protein
VRAAKEYSDVQHWRLFNYLMKGYNQSAVLVSGENSLNGLPIRLGDLIAWPWRDPGVIDLKRRVGFSHSLGPAGQRRGRIHEPVSKCRPAFSLRRKAHVAFRSKFGDARYDVRVLYGPEFCDQIRLR